MFRFCTNGKRLTVSDVCRRHPLTMNGPVEEYHRTTFADDPRRQQWNTKEGLFWQRYETASNAYFTNAHMKLQNLPIFTLWCKLEKIWLIFKMSCHAVLFCSCQLFCCIIALILQCTKQSPSLDPNKIMACWMG